MGMFHRSLSGVEAYTHITQQPRTSRFAMMYGVMEGSSYGRGGGNKISLMAEGDSSFIDCHVTDIVLD